MRVIERPKLTRVEYQTIKQFFVPKVLHYVFADELNYPTHGKFGAKLPSYIRDINSIFFTRIEILPLISCLANKYICNTKYTKLLLKKYAGLYIAFEFTMDTQILNNYLDKNNFSIDIHRKYAFPIKIMLNNRCNGIMYKIFNYYVGCVSRLMFKCPQ